MAYSLQAPRMAWSEDEDQCLKAAVARYGVKRWAQIAALLPGRTSKACSHRWRTYLQPGVMHTSTNPFTEWEVAVVKEAHKVLGNNWSAIARMLPGRTNAAVKNFWYAHKRRSQRARGRGQAVRQGGAADQATGAAAGADEDADDELLCDGDGDADVDFDFDEFDLDGDLEGTADLVDDGQLDDGALDAEDGDGGARGGGAGAGADGCHGGLVDGELVMPAGSGHGYDHILGGMPMGAAWGGAMGAAGDLAHAAANGGMPLRPHQSDAVSGADCCSSQPAPCAGSRSPATPTTKSPEYQPRAAEHRVSCTHSWSGGVQQHQQHQQQQQQQQHHHHHVLAASPGNPGPGLPADHRREVAASSGGAEPSPDLKGSPPLAQGLSGNAADAEAAAAAASAVLPPPATQPAAAWQGFSMPAFAQAASPAASPQLQLCSQQQQQQQQQQQPSGETRRLSHLQAVLVEDWGAMPAPPVRQSCCSDGGASSASAQEVHRLTQQPIGRPAAWGTAGCAALAVQLGRVHAHLQHDAHGSGSYSSVPLQLLEQQQQQQQQQQQRRRQHVAAGPATHPAKRACILDLSDSALAMESRGAMGAHQPRQLAAGSARQVPAGAVPAPAAAAAAAGEMLDHAGHAAAIAGGLS